MASRQPSPGAPIMSAARTRAPSKGTSPNSLRDPVDHPERALLDARLAHRHGEGGQPLVLGHVGVGDSTYATSPEQEEQPICLHRPRRAQAQGPVRLRRADAPAGRPAAPAPHDQRDHHRVRRGHLRRRPRPGGRQDRRARRGLAAGHDRRQPRAGAGRARPRGPLPQDREPARRPGARRPRPATAPRLDATSPGPSSSGDAPGPTRAAASPTASTGSPTGPRARSTAADDVSRAGRGPRRGPAVGGAGHTGDDDTWAKVYLYSRAQSVMGGTAEIERNLIANRILEFPNP